MVKQSFKLSLFLLTFTFLFSNQLSIENVDLSNGTLEVHMQNGVAVGGFQFDLTNVEVTGAEGGSAASNGFLISTSSTTVLGFSLTGGIIPSGEGTLLEVSFNGSPEEICLSSVVLSDPTGTQIDSDVGDCFIPGDGNDEAEGFEVDLVSTGESHLIIFQEIITGLDDGDQIGVFDASGVLLTVDPGQTVEYGEVLVGSGIWSSAQLEISAIMSIDLADFNGPVLNGAVDGNSVMVKVYDASEGVILDTEPTFTNGGEFGDLFTVVTDLGLSNDPDPVFGCTDLDACNYQSDATDDDGSCEYPEENFDCNGECQYELDCNGDCAGSAVEDECGECNGPGPDYECWNGVFVCDSEDCPSETGLVEISYTSYETIGGFQFDLDNVDVVGASGGDAETAGFLLSTNASTVLGFSLTGGTISAGDGLLVNVEVEGQGACLSDVVISDALGQSLDVSIDSCLSMTIGTQTILGCTDSSACNYNSDATSDDGSCEYPEENFDCNGDCIADIDCEGVCGGDSIVDECGECGGDGSSCQEELFVSFGEVDQENGVIEILMSNSTEVGGFQLEVSGIDIDSASGGSASDNGFTVSNSASTILGFSLTGTTIPAGSGALVYVSGAFNDDTVCFEDVILSSSTGDLLETEVGDCWTSNNVLGCTEVDACNYDSEATLNDGSCIYPEDNGWCDCDGNVEDCFGECGGDAVIDECGECDGDNASCTGCTDSNADNFDPDAIVSCNDCCEYPNYDGLVVINEINYNPGLSFDQADADYEFIELYNNSSTNIDLSGWNLSSDNINFTFESFEADAGAYILLARNTDTYPGSTGYGDNSLSNTSESITLTDSNEQIVDIVTYSDGFQGDDDQWPQGADAEGATLELISADLDNSIASSWQASFVIPGGTPGYENSSESLEVEGCTDLNACNYDSEATLDDGSCEFPEENFDCDGNCLVESDCNGECGGDAIVDECGDCDGNGADNECWDGSFVCDSVDCPAQPAAAYVAFGAFDSSNTEILFSSEVPIAGFQFSVNGTEILGAYGGAAESAGFTLSANSTTVLGFSLTGSTIPAGSAILTNVEWDLENGAEACIENVILSDASGSVIDVIADSCVQLDVATCDDSEACNFGNEGACEYPEENFDCEGNCIVDTDCSGECGGDAAVDECGECNGDNSSCSGGFEVDLVSTGESHLIIFQEAITGIDDGDQIGVFDASGVLSTVDPGQTVEYGEVLVGSGIWSGAQLEISAIMSIDLSDFNGPVLNGAVDGNSVMVKVYDASEGVILDADPTFTNGGEFGDLFTVVTDLGLSSDPDPVFGCTDSEACNYESDATDDDGSCEYPVENFDCDGNCLIEQDCFGECGGDAELDDCGVCEGDDSSCAVYVELEITTTLDEPLEDEEELQEFASDFENYMEVELGLPQGTVEVTNIIFTETRDVEVTIEFSVTLTEEELTESDFDADTIEEEIEETVSNVEEEIEEGLPDFVEGCIDENACNYNPEATLNDGSCEYPEENFDCNGDCIVGIDCFGDCGGDATEDCSGECGGSAELDDCGVCDGDGTSCESEGCTDDSACNFDPDATFDDGSCSYDFITYYLDTDGDGLGYGAGQEFCENPGNGWALNGDDLYPNCSSNFVDSCGVCDGDGGECAGCTDPQAFNANCLSGNLPLTATGGCNNDVVVDDGSCIYVPENFSFEQSTNQAYYFVIESQIDGEDLVELEDWIGAFKDGVCVGSWPWVGPYTTIPVMGFDGDELTEGYMQPGDTPEFVVFDGSELDSYPAEASEDFSWVNFEFYYLDNVNVYADCNGDLGGTAFVDDCGVCSGGNSQHNANSDDLGCGCFASEAIEYYFDTDNDGLGFGDASMYCSEVGTIFTENTEYELVPNGWVLNDADQCPFDLYNDSDSDGLCDSDDDCPYDSENDADQDEICGDEDSCPYDPQNDIDGDGVCGDVDPCPLDFDNDSDDDGLCDSDDEYPNCAANFYDCADVCGGQSFIDSCDQCVLVEVDSDADGIADSCDLEPECATNDTDECGICAGDNSTCSGCTDPQAFNFDCLTGELPQSAITGCGHNVQVDDGSCVYTPEGFQYNQSSLQAFYFVVDADLDEEPLAELEDWIGVFRDDVCVGAWPWQGPYTTLPAMGDDGEEYSEGYLLSGELPSFKIFDSSTGEVYDAEPSAEIAWANTGIYTLDFISGFSEVSYALDLHYGANLISFFALPDDLSLGNVFGSIEGLVTGVIGEGVAASPNPSLGWVGSLSEVQAISGYWVKMADAGILEGAGQPTDPETNFELHYGANLISYPFSGSAELGNTIPEAEWTNIDGVIGEGVAATYNPVIGWVGSLSGLEGGRGYWFKVSDLSGIDFTYIPPSDVSRQTFDSSELEQLSEFEFNQSTRQGFYFIESIEGVEDGDWVLSYNNNVLVGARKWNGSYTDIPAMGYDEDLNTAGYCETGDIIRFSIYRPSSGETYNLSSDNISPWEDNLIDIVTSLSIDYGNFVHGFELNDVYPNPFNPSTTINFTVSNDVNLSLVIYDMNGRIVDTLIDSNVVPGVYDIRWNASNYASGVYFAKLSSGAFEQTQKLILIK